MMLPFVQVTRPASHTNHPPANADNTTTRQETGSSGKATTALTPRIQQVARRQEEGERGMRAFALWCALWSALWCALCENALWCAAWELARWVCVGVPLAASRGAYNKFLVAVALTRRGTCAIMCSLWLSLACTCFCLTCTHALMHMSFVLIQSTSLRPCT